MLSVVFMVLGPAMVVGGLIDGWSSIFQTKDGKPYIVDLDDERPIPNDALTPRGWRAHHRGSLLIGAGPLVFAIGHSGILP